MNKSASPEERNSLIGLNPGESATVLRLDGGKGLTRKLAVLGFIPGAKVTMLQNFGRGPVIVSIGQARIALGRGEAMKVKVRVAENPS